MYSDKSTERSSRPVNNFNGFSRYLDRGEKSNLTSLTTNNPERHFAGRAVVAAQANGETYGR